MRVGAVDFIHQSAVTNSMHLQSTYTPRLQYLQSEARLESSRTSAVDHFCRNSQRVNPNFAGLFRGSFCGSGEGGGRGVKLHPLVQNS